MMSVAKTATTAGTLSAPELYALSQGFKCEGDLRCYWCASPCPRMWPHTDPPRILGRRVDSRLIRCPGNAYQCKGCWLFRRERITVRFLTNDSEQPFKDTQCPMNHSWFITEKGAWGIRRKEDAAVLYETLLDPPLLFSLSLVSDKQRNHLQIAPVNAMTEIKGDTPLAFVLDGASFYYSPYELETILTNGPSGTMPGTKALFDFFGPYKLGEEGITKRRKVGRPATDHAALKEIPAASKIIREEKPPEIPKGKKK